MEITGNITGGKPAHIQTLHVLGHKMSMNMISTYKIGVLMTVICALTGCDAFPEVIIVNNTGETLEFANGGQIIEDKSSLQLLSTSAYPAIRIHRHLAIISYEANLYVPKEYRGPSSPNIMSSNKFVMQVEPDGFIYLLYPDQEIPAHTLPPQPEGYPLAPVKTRKYEY